MQNIRHHNVRLWDFNNEHSSRGHLGCDTVYWCRRPTFRRALPPPSSGRSEWTAISAGRSPSSSPTAVISILPRFLLAPTDSVPSWEIWGIHDDENSSPGLLRCDSEQSAVLRNVGIIPHGLTGSQFRESRLEMCIYMFRPNIRHEDVWGSGGIAPRILNLCIRWRWVVSFTPRPL